MLRCVWCFSTSLFVERNHLLHQIEQSKFEYIFWIRIVRLIPIKNMSLVRPRKDVSKKMKLCSLLKVILFSNYKTYFFLSLDRLSSCKSLLFKGIVKRAEPCNCDIILASRVLWYKRITPFFKRMEILIFDTHRRLSVIISPYKFTQRLSSEGCLFSSGKNWWRRGLEANKKQVPLKSYSLKIRVDSVSKILKKKVT